MGSWLELISSIKIITFGGRENQFIRLDNSLKPILSYRLNYIY
jgi:hypothetical protein